MGRVSETPAVLASPARVGPRLEAMRMALGLKKAQLADTIGCNRSHWIKYEKGERALTVAVAERLSDAYGFGFNFLYRGDLSDVPADLRPVVAGLLRKA